MPKTKRSTPPKPPQEISTADTATMLGCTLHHVRQLIDSGVLVARKLNERAWAIQRSSVEAFARKPHPRGQGRPRNWTRRVLPKRKRTKARGR